MPNLVQQINLKIHNKSSWIINRIKPHLRTILAVLLFLGMLSLIIFSTVEGFEISPSNPKKRVRFAPDYQKELSMFRTFSSEEQAKYLALSKDEKQIQYGSKLM